MVKSDKKLIFGAPRGPREMCQKVQLAKLPILGCAIALLSTDKQLQHPLPRCVSSAVHKSHEGPLHGQVAQCKQRVPPAPCTHVQMAEKQLCDPSSQTLLHTTFILTVGHVNPTDSHTSLVIGFRFSAFSHAGYEHKLRHFLLHLGVPQRVLVNRI